MRIKYSLHTFDVCVSGRRWYNCKWWPTRFKYFGIYLFIYSSSALHVSDDLFAHHQEHLNVFTASDIVHRYCCWLVSWMRWNCIWFIYLFIPHQLYVFRTMSSSIIRSTWLYLQHLILSTVIAARWCHGWDGTAFGSFIYLFLISSTCFGRCLRPSSGALECIYSIWYCPLVLLPAGVMDEMELQFHLIRDTSRQQYRWTISDAVNTVKCSWWWAKTSPETCRAD